MLIRRATLGDAALLAEHRAAVWHEVGDWSRADLDPQIGIWTAFFGRHLVSGTYIGFIAEAGESVVGSGGILLHLAIPRPGLASDCAGRVQSVYVVPSARRRGIARSILNEMLEYSRGGSLISLGLHPSETARPLYEELGFQAADEMILRFTSG